MVRISDQYFNSRGTFVPAILANELIREYSPINVGERIHVYQKATGVYISGEAFLRRECRQRLQNASEIKRVDEVIAHIADMRYVEPDAINTHKHLINLQNGMLNWATGDLLPHSEKHLSTVQNPVSYDPHATCPAIDAFLESILPPDCILLVEELFGCLLVLTTKYEIAFIFTGTGANGKSTLLNLIDFFIGTRNVSKIPLQELDRSRFKRAELYGKSANIFADLGEKSMEDSGYFKAIVSGDPIDAERKYKDPFWFRPTARLIFSANQIPYTHDRSYAYYRRLITIPFPNQFVGDEADRNLIEKLTQPDELSGLLNCALTGLRRLFEQGHFSRSETAEKTLDDYRKSNDPVEAFLQDYCDFEDFEARAERTALYAMYIQYCRSEGRGRASRQKFYDRIRARLGSDAEAMGDHGKRYFVGIRVKRS